MNYLNQLICDSKVTEMKALENLCVDEYYQTLATWIKIIDEKNKAVENNMDPEKPKSGKRKKLGNGS
jgi:hypothetical protein